jgi:N-acyl-D-aspartate/D-glutamate deacylase
MKNSSLQRYMLAFSFVVLLFVVAPLRPQEQARPFDIVIINGHIIDGTGSPWYSGDIGIRDGKIASIGNLNAAPRTRTIDAVGKVVAPGFIDMLGQSEGTILVDPRLPSKIYQGTTPFFAPIRSITTNITSRLTGGPFANISPASRSKAWESIWPATWAPRAYAAWCSAITTCSPPPRSSSR